MSGSVDNAAPVTGNTVGGYKAAISNPRVGDEARTHAKNVLKEMDEMEGDLSGEYVDSADRDEPFPARDGANARETLATSEKAGKNEGNVVGGYKATLSNPNTGDDAKERARKELDKRGADY